MRRVFFLVLGVCWAGCDPGPSGPLASGRFPGPAGERLYDHLPIVAPPPIADGELAPRAGYGGMWISDRLLLARFAEHATVGEANELLDRHGLRAVGSSPLGSVVLELSPPDVDALFDAARALQDEALVEAAAPDVLAFGDSLPPPSDRPGQAWEATPRGENFSLELIRAPQAWSLLDHRAADVEVAVLDGAFTAHPELDGRLVALDLEGGWRLSDPDGDRAFDHGMNVACIIGAAHDDERGTAGVAPFVRVHGFGARAYRGYVDPGVHVQRVSDSFHAQTLAALETQARVVNVSQGYGWREVGVDPYDSSRHPFAEPLVAQHGRIARADLERANLARPILFVVSAGNDGEFARGTLGRDAFDARLNSPWTYAALNVDPREAPASRHVIVVENVGGSGPYVRGEPGTAIALADVANRYGGTLFDTSNGGGHVSAPGRAVWACGRADYISRDGTSQAAPHVTGLAALLAAFEPSLTNDELRVLLRGNTTRNPPVDPAFMVEIPSVVPTVRIAPLPEARAMIDAFAAVLSIDLLREGTPMQIALVDTDDRTPDGNQRLARFADGRIRERDVPEPTEGGRVVRGDHRVDMRDFRRFRDALILARGDGDLLDGSASAIKRDLDGDGTVRPVAQEVTYSRFDFNGDGSLDPTLVVDFPGLWQIAGFDDTLHTDLEVLQAVWGTRGPRGDPAILPDTEGWIADDLPHLIESVDIEVDLAPFFAEHQADPTPVERVEVRYRSRSASFPRDAGGRPVEAGATREAIRRESERLRMTVPALPDAYLEIEPRNASGAAIDIQDIPLAFARTDGDPVEATTVVRSHDLPPLRAGNDLWIRYGRAPDPPELRIAYVAVDGSRPDATGIYTVLPDGSDLRPLLTGIAEARNGGSIACQQGGELLWFVSTADFGNVYRVRTDGTESTRITSAASSTGYGGIDVSPDGTTIALTRDGDVVRLDLATLAVTALTSDGGGWSDPRFAPDAATIYAARESRIHSIPAGGGAATPLTPETVRIDVMGFPLDVPVTAAYPGVAPASGRIAFVTNYGTVRTVPPPSDTSVAELYWIDPATPSMFVEITDRSGAGFSKLTPAWSPDEATVAFTGNESGASTTSLYVVASSGGTIVRIGPEPTANAFTPCWIAPPP